MASVRQRPDGRWWWHTENGDVQLFVDAHTDLEASNA